MTMFKPKFAAPAAVLFGLLIDAGAVGSDAGDSL